MRMTATTKLTTTERTEKPDRMNAQRIGQLIKSQSKTPSNELVGVWSDRFGRLTVPLMIPFSDAFRIRMVVGYCDGIENPGKRSTVMELKVQIFV